MSKRAPKFTICPNCDYSFNETDNFCPNCGQKNQSYKIPVKHFILDAVDSYFNFDTKMVNTLRDMFVKPGLITYNYNQGKRARYVSPMKLFIFVSFVFFLLLGFKNARNYESPSDNAFNINLKMNIAHIDSADINILTAKNQLTNAYLDSFCALRRVKLGWFNRPLVRNYLRIKSGHISMEEFNNRVIKSASTMVFFLMPLFALFVYLFYRLLKCT